MTTRVTRPATTASEVHSPATIATQTSVDRIRARWASPFPLPTIPAGQAGIRGVQLAARGDLRSVTAPLISYVPQDLDITLPLQEAQNLNKGETSVLSTVPENSTEPTLRGMFVRSTGDGLDVVLRNVVPLSLSKDELKQLPKDAKLRITSNSEVTRVWVPDATRKDGTPMDASIADDIRPMVTGIYSEITNNPESAKKATDAGLHAHVTVDSRFSSSPPS